MSNNDFGDYSDNTYQPAMPTAGYASGTKPASLTVFGILNLVFAAMELCGVGTFVVHTLFVGVADNWLLETSDSWTYFVFTVVKMGVGFIATIVLIISGVGLLDSRPYGRTFAIGWAIYSIVAGIVGAVFNIMFLLIPLTERNIYMPGPEKAVMIAVSVGFTVSGLCWIVYPLVLLLFMTRAPVINFLKSQA